MDKQPPRQNKSQITYVNGLGFIPETPKQFEHKQLLLQYNILLFSIFLLFLLRSVTYGPLVRLLSLTDLVKVNPLTGLVTMSDTATQLIKIISMCIYFGIPTLIIFMYGRRVFSAKKLFGQPNPHTTRYSITILTSVSVIAYFISHFFIEMLNRGGLVIGYRAESPPQEILPFVLYFLSATLIPAFLEELLFRGAVLNSLRRFGDFVGVIVSTFLYILVQPSLEQMVYAAVMGMALGYFTVKSGSIWTAIAGSFIVKGINIIRDLIEWNVSYQTASLFFYLAAFVMLLVGIIAFILFVRRDRYAFQLYGESTLLTNRHKVKMFFSNLGLWIVIVWSFFHVVRHIQIIG